MERAWVGCAIASAGVQIFAILTMICGLWPADCANAKRSTLYLVASILCLLAGEALNYLLSVIPWKTILMILKFLNHAMILQHHLQWHLLVGYPDNCTPSRALCSYYYYDRFPWIRFWFTGIYRCNMFRIYKKINFSKTCIYFPTIFTPVL